MKIEFFIKPINDQDFPWGVFEGSELVGRFQEHFIALNVMKSLAKE